MAHNNQEIDDYRLFALLESISSYLDIKTSFYALGGTALTLRGIKKSTLDIDINVSTEQEYARISSLFQDIGFERKGPARWITQEGLAFDLFHGFSIFGTHLLPDSLDKATFIKSLGNIQLYALSLPDIVISKLARGDSRDFADIKTIFENEKIDLISLVERYKRTMEASIVSGYKAKLLDLIELKFKDWGFHLNQGIIEEVHAWQ